MSPPRAADDFPVIRARMDELRREPIRPRAAGRSPSLRASLPGRPRPAPAEAERGRRPRPCRPVPL